MISTIFWDPDRNIFVIPFLNHPVTWYGLLFAFGFMVAYFFLRSLFTGQLASGENDTPERRLEAIHLVDRLTILVILGTIIGARLGHVFFYGWSYYKNHPGDIFKIWEGGLASHGGAIGILIALLIFALWHRKKYPSLTFWAVLDAIVIPTAFVGGCIRIGNFINQEVLGKPTTLPWAVSYGHPIEGPPGVPLHPVQLYESFYYFLVFLILYFVWQNLGRKVGRCILSGLFFVLVFGFRFLIEFLKLPQSDLLSGSGGLNMGQILSLPFIAIGVILLVCSRWTKRS